MGSRSHNAWHLVKASCSVLNKDRELLILAVFPLVGVVASIVLSLGLTLSAFTATSGSEADKTLPTLFVALIIFTALLFVMIISVSCEGSELQSREKAALGAVCYDYFCVL